MTSLFVKCKNCSHARHSHEQGEECNVAVLRSGERDADAFDRIDTTTFCPCERFTWPDKEIK